MKRRWLVAMGLSVSLGGCVYQDYVCPGPDGKTPSTAPACYYHLTLTKVDKTSGELRGKVAQSVIDNNRFWRSELQNYPPTEYHLHLADPLVSASKWNENEDHWFVRKPGAEFLEEWTPTAEHLKEYHTKK
jgi:hypothetical protein